MLLETISKTPNFVSRNITEDNNRILVRNLAKKYQEYVFKDLNLDIELNKMTCIIGDSGSGKSTLLHLLGGLDKQSCGQIRFPFKLNVFDPLLRAKHLGFVFQSHYLINDFTVLENVMCPASILHSSDLARELAIKALEQTGVNHLCNRNPNQLSGGEQQRVAIARAIVNRPQFLLADEPTGNLDSNNARKILGLFLHLRDIGVTVILVTHSEMVYRNADIVYKINEGQIARLNKNEM